MLNTDIQGNALSGADATGAMAFSDAVRQFSIYAGDPLAAADALITGQPGFVMAHALKAWLYLLGTDARAAAAARDIVAATDGLEATRREQGHLAAIKHLVDGRFHAASQAIEDVSAENPHDLLALIAGHQLDFFTGNSRMLRDRISRARPHWSASQPGYHAVLGMHAFGLEEMGDYTRAEASGREALEHERCDGWARHAVAHVLEMQGRPDEGIAFMRGDVESWTEGSFFAVHNWWHLALYHLELGQIDEVLKLVDGPITTVAQDQMIDLIDASAMLWRLQLCGTDVGQRWQALTKRYETTWVPGYYAFNDLHAVMAFLGAGRKDLIEAVIDAQHGVEADNVMFSRDVGLPLINGVIAFSEGRYQDAIALMRPVRGIAARFGGSHAQRDVIDLTLAEAALRGGDTALAQAFAAERLTAKHESPLAALFAKRAGLKRAA